MKKSHSLLKLLAATCCLLLLPSCLGSRGMRAQEIQADLALREMRSQIEDFKYQLNKYEVELQIVEGKADSQGSALKVMRQDIAQLSKNDEKTVQSAFETYNQKIEKLEGLEKRLKGDLLALKENTHEVLSSLAQFKVKIDGNEKHIADQKRYIEHLKSSLESLMKVMADPKDEGLCYVVCPGDSLDKIARENDLKIETIKNLNNMTSDLIVVGQKLRLK